MIRRVVLLILLVAVAAALLIVTTQRTTLYNVTGGTMPPLGDLLDPRDGILKSAREATVSHADSIPLNVIQLPARVVRDIRGVPHIFAESDRDAIVALGYTVAQDRLFQLYFVPRIASGRLAEVFGEDRVAADRFLRRTGMRDGAQANLERIEAEQGIEADLLRWFAQGVNAYLTSLDEADLPLEFQFLGYVPEPYTPLHSLLISQYMGYTLSYGTDRSSYGELQNSMSEAEYEMLFPRHQRLADPIVPGGWRPGGAEPEPEDSVQGGLGQLDAVHPAYTLLELIRAGERSRWNTLLQGHREGIGSNNWAVDAAHSTTAAPMLANDMHLQLTLPSIWYESHVVTPSMNTYGVGVPGSPLPIQAYNEHLGWGFTNAPVDQIDHYALQLDEEQARYRFGDGWRDLQIVIDTIRVAGSAPVVDTLHYAHWGPVIEMDSTHAVAIQWTVHKPSRTLAALWEMNHAASYAEFEDALRLWDSPAQNILYAGRDGTIAIRTTGHIPVRASGTAVGLLDGSSDAAAWTGRIPFEELPHAVNPDQGYLASANQQPADSTYPYYLGHNWRATFRAMRINDLLRMKERHSLTDMKQYQADVHAVQRDLFVPLLAPLRDLEARADTLRRLLTTWDGTTAKDRPEPLILDEFLSALRLLAWDEFREDDLPAPQDPQLLYLLEEEPNSEWLDIEDTRLRRENAVDLLSLALTSAVDSLERKYGWDRNRWRWGEHHKIRINHLLGEAMPSFGRGPYPFPGFRSTLTPGGSRETTSSVSWRVVVDFSETPPVGYGVLPGGQSGNPASPLYDDSIPVFLNFGYHRLLNPRSPAELPTEQMLSTQVLHPYGTP